MPNKTMKMEKCKEAASRRSLGLPVGETGQLLLRAFAALALLSVASLPSGCATVPKEAVELSYQMGQDLNEMHRACDAMVARQFDGFRAKRIAYLENEWIPLFLEDWVNEGKLVEVAKGEVVWSTVEDDFVAPTSGRERQDLLATVREWSDSAMAMIDEKRTALVAPLNQEEAAIRDDLREAFDRMGRANAHITAHLNSIRKVHEIQTEALDRLGLRDVVERLDQAIVRISETAETGLNEIRRADKTLDETVDKGKKLIERAKGGK